MGSIEEVRRRLGEGLVIPACPLALNARRKLDEERKRGLFKYYVGAGAGGLAVGVHTTQFAIREPKVGLFRPVLELAAEVALGELSNAGWRKSRSGRGGSREPVLVAGICGRTKQAES